MIAFIIARGIGFNPGGVQFIPTLGFGIGAAPPPSAPVIYMWEKRV